MTQALPQIFGRYVLTNVIGEGGMAEVYLANVRVAEGLTKRVVIKKIRREFAEQPEFTRMFVDEAKIALSLNHANIVQVFDFGQVRGTFYLAMELVEGSDLMRLFNAVRSVGQTFPPVIAAYVGHQVTAGLAYAHRKRDDFGNALGIVHRDVSPHNVMVSYEGQVKILDFGIARTKARAYQRMHDPGRFGDGSDAETIKGKVAYMSPEQAHGRSVDRRSDLYSLGVVLYELLTGQLLFRNKDRLTALELVRTQPIRPIGELAPDVPEALQRIVDRALARDPEQRYEHARAMQGDLATFLHRADPVVDDEVLSQFIAQYDHPRQPSSTTITSSHAGSRDVGDSHGTQLSVKPLREAQRVVVVHVALEPRSTPGSPPPDTTKFLGLAHDVAFKREAQVLHSDERSVVLAFGVVPTGSDDAERALRVALVLREEIGETAPSVAMGVAVATAPCVIQHDENGTLSVELRPTAVAQIERLAQRAIEGPVMVAGDLVDRLSRSWSFGDMHPVPSDEPGTFTSEPELEQAAPLLGPITETERRVHHAPGGRVLLYGRELELKALRDAFAEAIRARESRAVVLIGQPGIGKHAVVDRFVAALPRRACWVLRAAGSWSRRNVPLGVFLQLIAGFLQVDRTTTLAQISERLIGYRIREPEKLAEALHAALGAAGSDALDPLERRDRLWRLIRRLIRALALRRPLLVLIENVHFIDEQSMDVLREWLRVRHPLPILGLTTGRPGPRCDALRREATVSAIELGELDEQARRELIVRRFEDPDAANDLADAILARTGGNPLFIEETLASLLHRGIIGWNPQGRYLALLDPDATIELPPSVEGALQARLDDLPPPDREVLQAASVLGRVFEESSVADLLERSVAKHLEALQGRNLLERVAATGPSGATLRFPTVSLHEVCKGSTPRAFAEQLHGRAALLKRTRPDYTPGRDDGPVADHLIAAGRPVEAVEFALRAARHAQEVASNVEAYYHLSQALKAMLEDDPRRFEALFEREAILRAWGQRRAQGADIRQLIHTAERYGSAEDEVLASLRLFRFYLEVGRRHSAERLCPRLEQRIARLPAANPYRAAFGELRSELLFLQGRFAEAESVAEQALAHCDDDERGLRQRCRITIQLGRVQLGRGELEQARRTFELALQLARRIQNRRLEAEVLNSLGEVAGRCTRYQAAIDHFKAALAIDRDLGDRFATGRKLANLGATFLAIGLLRRAERYLRKALELHEAVGDPAAFNDVVVSLGEVLAFSGEIEAARTVLIEAAKVAQRRGDIRTELRARVRLAYGLLEYGHAPEDHEEARKLAKAVLSAARDLNFRTAVVRARHVLARVAELQGDIDAAIDHETEAVGLVRAGAASIDGVRSVHHLGRMLVARGNLEEGHSYLREAMAAVQARLDDLRDPDLRRGYLAQADVLTILNDGQPLPAPDTSPG